MGNCKYMMFEGTVLEKNKSQFTKDVIFDVCHSSQIAINFKEDQGSIEVLGVVYSSSMRGTDFIDHAIKYIKNGRVIFHDADWNCMNNNEEVDLYIISDGQFQMYNLSGKGGKIKIKGVKQ